MAELNKRLRASALLMRIVGWGGIVGGPVLSFAYAPGFFWGELPEGFPHFRPTPSPITHIMGRTRTS